MVCMIIQVDKILFSILYGLSNKINSKIGHSGAL